MTTVFNDIIIENLEILYENELINGNIFKANSYKKTLTSIKNTDIKIKSLDDIKTIDGIGKKIFDKIKEILETCKLKSVELLLKDPKYILGKQLLNIYGIGPAKIKELINEISTIDDLKLDKNKHLLNDKQQIGLKYYDDLLLRIPKAEANKHNTLIKKTLNKINKNIDFEMVGSYRRKLKTTGDIDILIKYDPSFNLQIFIDDMISSGYIKETLANGKNKFMGICKLNDKLPARRIDILVSNEDNYYFALLYFTGSYKFNIYMRNISLEKGLSLSEYGFKDNKTKKIIDTSSIIKNEKDIFDYLKIDYTEPDKRL
jgi:DNA polymerase/3'-5' exonuclease PolX